MITLTVFRSFDNIVCRAPLVRINWCFSYKHIGRKSRAVKYHLHLIIFMAWYVIKIYDWRFHIWSCSKSSAHQVYFLYSHYFILELHIVKSVIVCTFFHSATYIPSLWEQCLSKWKIWEANKFSCALHWIFIDPAYVHIGVLREICTVCIYMSIRVCTHVESRRWGKSLSSSSLHYFFEVESPTEMKSLAIFGKLGW